MKLKNVKLGQRVQMKNIDTKPDRASIRTGREYGMIEENVGTIVSTTLDARGAIRVRFDDFEHTSIGGNILFIEPKHIRKVK